jgi:hypothetical protein
MVGNGTPLNWHKQGDGFAIDIPDRIRKSPPSEYVWVMKASF